LYDSLKSLWLLGKFMSQVAQVQGRDEADTADLDNGWGYTCAAERDTYVSARARAHEHALSTARHAVRVIPPPFLDAVYTCIGCQEKLA
jgi:hypothetical protein